MTEEKREWVIIEFYQCFKSEYSENIRQTYFVKRLQAKSQPDLHFSFCLLFEGLILHFLLLFYQLSEQRRKYPVKSKED